MRSHALLIALGLVACKGPPEPAPRTGSTPPSDAGTAAPAAPRVDTADEAAARARLDDWLAAQNTADFAAYQQLYAERMTGVKRVGAHTQRFGRAAWLADRQRMFRSRYRMEVSADDIVVRASAITVTVELTQTFRQGSFADQGRKRIVLVNHSGILRIVREEMLSSAPPVPWFPIDDRRPLRFVIEIDAKPYLVIGDGADAWATSPPRGPYPSSDPLFIALRDAGNAPAMATAWVGSSMPLYSARGRSCTGKIRSIALASGLSPGVAETQAWDEPGKVHSPQQRAEAVYAGGGPGYLVGALDVPPGCAPVFAVEGRTPQIFERDDHVAADLAARALIAFRRLPVSREVDPSVAPPAVTSYAADGRRFVSLVWRDDSPGCNQVRLNLWVLFEDRDGALRVVNHPDRDFYEPVALVDTDGDGTIEAIARSIEPGDYETHLVLDPHAYAIATQLSFPVYIEACD